MESRREGNNGMGMEGGGEGLREELEVETECEKKFI